MKESIGILGAGAWGTTLAILLYNKGYKINLFEYFPDYAEILNKKRENIKFLPGISIPDEIFITSNMEDIISGVSIIILAVPSFAMRNILNKLNSLEITKKLIVSVTKGIEEDTCLRMSQIIREILKDKVEIVVLSGPSHAEEVSKNIPTAVVVASNNDEKSKFVQDMFTTSFLRVYTSDDIAGVEYGGSLKNIIAIAAGVIDGVGFGDNTKSALLTRGLAEITRLGVAMGAKKETFYGLSGLGDLVVTCISKFSRNRFVGEEIGKGKTLEEILSKMEMIAEGVKTTKSVYKLSIEKKVEMPITKEVYEVLFNKKKPKDAVLSLMGRLQKEEVENL